MASITIRNLKDDVKRRLRMRAAENGRSMEEEARAVLEAGVAEHRDFSEERREYRAPAGSQEAARPRAGQGGGIQRRAAGEAISDDNIFDSIRRKFEPLGGVELRLPKRKGRKLPDFR